MVPGPGDEASARSMDVLADDILGPRERLEFEHLLQWLRLSFLLTPILVLLAFGTAAVPYALFITAVVAISFTWVGMLARFRPRLLLRIQLWLRVVDCGLVYVVLVNYHAFLHNAYYDAVYALFVVAAAATHGQRGAWLLSAVAGVMVLVSRFQLMASGAIAYEPRQLTDPVFFTLFFLITSRAVAFLMHKSAEVVVRRERAFSNEISARNEQLERTARELENSIRLRDAMLAGVTHDLRTPVTVIKVQAQLMRRRADERFASSIEQIERAATRMGRWIDELLEVATIQKAEDLELKLQQADLVEIARHSVEEHQAGTRRHQLCLNAATPEIVGEFDVPRLERVVDNLVGNAIKYSPEGGCVAVSLESTDGWVIISVRDPGIGIPEDDLAHVFEPFRRGGNVVGRFSGTGIGLSNAYRIVEGHGGRMSVVSQPGKGTTFSLRLPLRPRPHDD